MKENSDDFVIGQREAVERLVRLRQDPEAVPAIMLQLLAQKTGPADYLRTKREIQAFVASGGQAKYSICSTGPPFDVRRKNFAKPSARRRHKINGSRRDEQVFGWASDYSRAKRTVIDFRVAIHV